MWFVVDKDERDESEVQKMVARLGDSAELCVLDRRELENFLIDGDAIASFVSEKSGRQCTREQYLQALETSAAGLREKVTQMYLEKSLLRPIYLRGADASGSIEERLEKAGEEMQRRRTSIPALQVELESSLTSGWNAAAAIKLVPGEALLNSICNQLGSAFDKARGDSVKLAKHVKRSAIPGQIERILRALAASSGA